MTTRHMWPRRLSYRWFTTRGWAFGGAWTFLIAAVWLRPPGLSINAALLTGGFALASLSLFALGMFPEHVHVRLFAVGATVAATLIRSWALLNSHEQSLGYRVSSAIIWLWIAWTCWFLAMLTSQFPKRHH